MIIKKRFIYIQLLFLFLSLTGCQWMVLNRKNKYPDPTPSERRAYVDSHPEISHEMKKFILKRDIQIGMMKDYIIAALGLPDEIKKGNGKIYDELFIYYPHWNLVWRVYLKNNVVVKFK